MHTMHQSHTSVALGFHTIAINSHNNYIISIDKHGNECLNFHYLILCVIHITNHNMQGDTNYNCIFVNTRQINIIRTQDKLI